MSEAFVKGMPVFVSCHKLLSHGAVGEFIGYTKNAKGSVLCLVQLYEGAPPVRISPDKICLEVPDKFWMVVKRIQRLASYVYEEMEGAELAPRHKFHTRDDAIRYGTRIYGTDFFVLESETFTKNGHNISM